MYIILVIDICTLYNNNNNNKLTPQVATPTANANHEVQLRQAVEEEY